MRHFFLSKYKQLKQMASAADKSIFSIMEDYRVLFRTKGLQWNEYYKYSFEQQSDVFRKSFLGINEQRLYLDYLNPKKYYILCRNKYVTHLLLEHLSIPKARLYCYYNPESGISTPGRIGNDLVSVLHILREKNVLQCVIKATEGSHGDSVFGVSSIVYESNDASLTKWDGAIIRLSELLKQHALIFEERVMQTIQINKFNPSSVNTIRFMTTLMPDGKAQIIATFMKIGRSGVFVDNAGAGGNVDLGIKTSDGETYNAMAFNGFRNTTAIDVHPDSKIELNGVKIDHWKEICEKVCSYQESLSFIKAIGWDVAITDNGPVIIELNDFWDTTGQLYINRGWRKEIRKCYMEWKKHNSIRNINYNMGRINPTSNILFQKLKICKYYDIYKKNSKNNI